MATVTVNGSQYTVPQSVANLGGDNPATLAMLLKNNPGSFTPVTPASAPNVTVSSTYVPAGSSGGGSFAPTPPPNMTAPQQAAWNYAVSLIPGNPSAPAPVPTPGPKPVVVGPIGVDSLSSTVVPFNPQTPISEPVPPTVTAKAVADARAAQIAEAAKVQALTQNRQQESDLTKQLMDYVNQEAEKPAYKQQQESAYGIDQKQATVNSLQAKAQILANEAAQIQMTPDPREGITTGEATGRRNEALRVNAIAALSVSSLIAAAQGDLANATNLVTRAVDAKFQPIEAHINALNANLQLVRNDPQTTAQEKAQLNAQQAINDKLKAAVDDAKQTMTDVMNVGVKSAANGANFTPTKDFSTLAEALQAIQNAPDAISATQIASSVGLSEGSTTTAGITEYNFAKSQGYKGTFQQWQDRNGGTGGTFTAAQVNKGAAVAGTDVATFNSYSPTARNVFINGDVAGAKSDIEKAINSGDSVQKVTNDIATLNLPQEVTAYLTKYAQTFAANNNTSPEEVQRTISDAATQLHAQGYTADETRNALITSINGKAVDANGNPDISQLPNVYQTYITSAVSTIYPSTKPWWQFW